MKSYDVNLSELQADFTDMSSKQWKQKSWFDDNKPSW